ncbi:Nitrilase/cyanide hydratase and apolipo protein N-acyltransferase [Rhodotorula diobovata]|uniref:Nitrilase/cyanide hydratase and apolipo protein N-acyltransferase n=1 Tax=Rhodotorula diobovata TaxID=5288 RepID=A0A5C5G9K8_9BASI|nr:Nitrilase/cyanide hydratase and apolipo protein N-acyltransferase [Rhodotorula diobovata]
MAPVKVAAVQVASAAFDLAGSLSKFIDYCREAAEEGARLAVFPEAFLSAYPRHLEFKVGARTDENRTWYRKYVELSVRVPDGSEGVDWLQTDEAEAVTREGDDFYAFKLILGNAQINNLNLSVGIIERSLTGATLWCTNLIVSDKGILLGLSAFLSPSSPFLPPLPPRCLLFPLLSLHPAVRTQDSHPRARAAGRHRKLIPTAAERVVWASSSLTNPPQAIDSPHPPTDNLPVVPTSVGRVGGVICWEHFNALTRYALYRKDVQVWVAPTADARPTWAPSMQFIAQEGRCFVVSANQFQRAADFPEDYPYRVARAAAGEGGDGPDEVWSRGGSCIVNPLGEILAGPLWDREGIVCAEIDVDDILGYKLDMDGAGSAHYAREDLFHFALRT